MNGSLVYYNLHGRSFFPDGFLSRRFLVEPFFIQNSGRTWSWSDKKKSLTLVRDFRFLKGKGFYPSTTLYLVPFNVIFLMLSIVKLCGLCLFSWGCLLVSDFLTSKERNNSRSILLPSNSYSVE